MTNLKFNAVTVLPIPTPINAGKIYVTTDGSQYVTKSDGEYLKISDTIFVTELPTVSQLNKLYILTDVNGDTSMHIWDGVSYVNLSQIVSVNARNVIESSDKVFVSSNQRSQIDSNTTELNSHSQRLSTLQTDIASIISTDEKVKMDSTSVSSYLIELVDGITLQNKNGKLTVKSIDGVTVTNNELNMLQGVKSNLQSQLNALTSVGNFTTSITNYTDLAMVSSPATNDMVIITNDESRDDSSTIYIFNGTDWSFAGEFKSGEIRDFTINPINLVTETTGVLPKSRYEKQIASETSVSDTDNNFTSTNVEGVLKELNQKIDNSSTGGGSSVTLNNTVTSTSETEAATANAVKVAYDKGVEALNKANTELPNASTTTAGIVKLNNTVSSTSTTEAGTANSVKTAYDLANTANIKANTNGTTSVAGIVKLNSAINSTSTTEASTPSAVKQAYDLANSKASTANYTATIGTTWTGTVAPFTQTITVSGMLSSDTPFVFPVYSAINTTAILEDETWSMIGKITTATNSITVTCFEEKPVTALTIQLKVVR